MSQPRLPNQRYRAPRQHGQLLIEPGWGGIPALLVRNRNVLTRRHDRDCQGVSLAELSGAARQLLYQQAFGYTQQYRDLALPATYSAATPIVMGGHQPQLFHPGVWLKNLGLARIAEQLGAAPIQLLIDNDTVARPAITAPTGSVVAPRTVAIPLDAPERELSFEERVIRDDSVFNSFAQRVADAVGTLGIQPLVARLWGDHPARVGINLGRMVAQLRHQMEGAWGYQSLELPLSEVCDTRPFRQFACALLARLPQLHRDYNASLAEYRRANRVRSAAQPLPDLSERHGWLETPLWIWTVDDPVRRPLYARAARDTIELSDMSHVHEKFELTADGDTARAVEKWGELRGAGIKLRPRALLTTMYCRLVLSDVFFHGIGGAKYDQVTDRIARRFFGIEPPQHVTLTATAHLPIEYQHVDAGQLAENRQRLREMVYHPEKHVEQNEHTRRWVQEKWEWIRRSPPRGQRLPRHRAIERANAALSQTLVSQCASLREEGRWLQNQIERQQVLASREYSFCLFPEAMLRDFFVERLPRGLTEDAMRP